MFYCYVLIRNLILYNVYPFYLIYYTDCPPQVNVLAIVLGVIAGIVLVGLALLLIWKLVTTISDKRELARFEREAQNAKWDTVSCVIKIHVISVSSSAGL